ncbi:MAG TPA: c-type cytochrome, partial [Planctomycetota bacterium]|nr:c-type cytochrome [Planctomycetota bacterium]
RTLADWAVGAVRPAGDAPQPGAPQLIARMGCLACHTLDGRGAKVGPVLNGVRSRKTREEIITWLRDPQAVKPGTIMPAFSMSELDRQLIADYLLTR